MDETLTFGLATAGYTGLTAGAVLAARRRSSRLLSAVVAVIVAAHVILVWDQRFDWSLARATRNGTPALRCFTPPSPASRSRRCRRCVWRGS